LINDIVLHSEEFDVVSADVDFGEAVEAVAIGSCVDYGVESEIHPVVTGREVTYPSAMSAQQRCQRGCISARGLPLKVSPLLSSTSMGEPWAAVNSDNGSCASAREIRMDGACYHVSNVSNVFVVVTKSAICEPESAHHTESKRTGLCPLQPTKRPRVSGSNS
jgi:hypothetical protein